MTDVQAQQRPVPVVLAIAGSDSGGGAGIQADLKAFARAGVHGTTAITAITVQNTTSVSAVHPVPTDVIGAQIRAVAEDLGVDAVKIGMLGDAATIHAVAEALDALPEGTPVVLDPVMVAESGARLLAEEAQRALATELVPRATVITPNVPEARVLTGLSESATAEELVRALHALGPQVAMVTGGHRDSVTDLVFDGSTLTEVQGERHPDGAAHGSGCTHSSTLAAHLALGATPLEAARAAKAAASVAVRDGLRELGHGAGPVDVFGLRHGAPAPAAPPAGGPAAVTPGTPPTGASGTPAQVATPGSPTTPRR
jgi:hydroxymethylpyrimidine/phosphomethylpyrimidine kinase